VTIREKIEQFKREQWEKEQQRRWDKLEWEREYNETKRQFAENVAPYIRPAQKTDYLLWMKEWLEAGNMPTHYYDRPFDNYKMYVLMSNIELPALYGVMSIDLIIPLGCDVSFRDRGHCNLYYRRGPRLEGHCAPLYSDMEF